MMIGQLRCRDVNVCQNVQINIKMSRINITPSHYESFGFSVCVLILLAGLQFSSFLTKKGTNDFTV